MAFLEGRKEVSDEAGAGRLSTTITDGNAPLHTAFALTRFLVDSKAPRVALPPYCPDMASPDFLLFPRLKTPMKGHHFGTVDKVRVLHQGFNEHSGGDLP